ncbi:TetR/AcrR family transcriptional regulator [soil metagenome]
MAQEPGGMRSDAQRNRDRILQVAHDAFAESGAASLNEIAKRAGIGPGTLYRHFPTREALILAVYRRDVQRLVESVPDVLARHEPLDAFRTWFQTLADYIRIKHGLGEALQSAAVTDAINETYEPVIGAVGLLIDACVRSGVMREGLQPGDVLLLMSFLWRVEAGNDGREQGRRLMDLVVEGLHG